MAGNNIELGPIFQAVTQALINNQQTLNQTDGVNQNHGDNMVQTFQTITNALQSQQGASSTDALAYAAQQLSQNTNSNSGQLYAQGLAQAADQLQGKPVDSQLALQLLQTLVGGGQPQQQGAQPSLGSLLEGLAGSGDPQNTSAQSGSDDLIGNLLGGLASSGNPQNAPAQSGGEDLLGSLLGGLAGSGNADSGTNNGLDMGDLLNAGMAFMQAKQSGGNNAEALIQAFMAGSGMGGSPHRAQSTQLVINSFLQALGSASAAR